MEQSQESKEVTAIIDNLCDGVITPDEVVKKINNKELMLKWCDRWVIGEFLYKNFHVNEMSKDTWRYAARASCMCNPMCVVADSTPDKNWGINRLARQNFWRPFYRGKVSPYYFRADKYSGVGWRFASIAVENRVIFMASITVMKQEENFVWEFSMDTEKFSPIHSIRDPQNWFHPKRVGCYIVEKLDIERSKLDYNKIINKISMYKQHVFSNSQDVEMFVVSGESMLYVNVMRDVVFTNVYMGHCVLLTQGVYTFKVLQINSFRNTKKED